VYTKRIHVFKAGDQTSAQGVQRKFTPKELDQVVKSYDPSIHEAPLVLGHAGDNDSLPSFGWIQGFTREGDNLYADVSFTDTAKDLVKDGHYRKVSISFYSPESAINPHKGKWSARHLALLGASPPAVKGLEPFSFSEAEGVFDFAATTLSPETLFDEDLGPTMIVEKSPLQMLQEKLEEVREDVSGAVKELQTNQQTQPTEALEEVTTSSVTEQPEAAQMANPDASNFKETRNTGREGTEIAQQTADLETQFPEEEFMEKGKISRKHAKGADGQVMQVVENVYEEAHKESTAERKEAADRGFERKRQLKEGKKGEAHETEELMKMEDKKLSSDHKEKQGYNDRLDESLGARNGKKSQSMKDRRDESEGMEKAMGKRKYAGDKSMDHSEFDYEEDDEGRYETARSDSDGYADRMKTGKEDGAGKTGRMKTAKSSEQENDRMHTAKSGEQQEDRMHTGRIGEFGKGDTGRWAGQEDGYDQVHNGDQYDAGKEDYPEGSKPEESTGTDPYGRKEGATKIPVETEEMPDNEIFAVQTQNVMSDKNMRVLRQKSSSEATKVSTHNYMYGEPEADEMTTDDGVTTARKGMTAEKTVEHGEYDSGDLGGGASFDKLREEVGDGKPAKNKLLTPGAQDSLDDPAAIVGPDGAYAESYKGEPKAKNKLLVPGEQDSVTDPAETVGPDGAYKEASLDQLREDIGDGKKSKARQLTPGAMDDVDTPAEISKKSGGAYAEEHAEGKKDPYTKTGFGSTYEEGEGDSGVDEGEESYSEDTVDHSCGGMSYGMGPEQMYEELMALKSKYAELEKRNRQEKMDFRRMQMAEAIGHLYTEGRLTDGVMPEQELLSYVEGLEFGTLEFSEGETAATKLLTLLSNLPPMVSFGEVAGGSFQYAEESDLDPHAKALKMVESGECQDYVEALKKTMFS